MNNVISIIKYDYYGKVTRVTLAKKMIKSCHTLSIQRKKNPSN